MYRHTWPGVMVWVIVLSGIVFQGTRLSWFDKMSPDNQPMFWTNLAVAAGTLALAAVTYWNVSQTNAVIAGEDRRHQQQFAPLIKLSTNLPSIEISNIGNGLAIDISVSFVGTMHYTELAERIITEDELKELAQQYGGATTKSGPDGELIYVYTVPAESKVERTVSASAVEKDGSFSAFIEEFYRIAGLKVLFQSAVVSYKDMFGNNYSTTYSDDTLRVYDWHQPERLEIPT